MESGEPQQSAGSQEAGAKTGSEANLPRKEREKAQHRGDILRAAEGLLSKKSYAEIGVQ